MNDEPLEEGEVCCIKHAFAAVMEGEYHNQWSVVSVTRDRKLYLEHNLTLGEAKRALALTFEYLLTERFDKATKRWVPNLSPTKRLRRTRPALRVDTRFDVLRRDGYRCRYCGRQAPEVILHVDHVVPVSKGGTSDPDNLVTSCRDCNLGKRTGPA